MFYYFLPNINNNEKHNTFFIYKITLRATFVYSLWGAYIYIYIYRNRGKGRLKHSIRLFLIVLLFVVYFDGNKNRR